MGQDIRYGLRMLAKSPVFTLIAILTLALGIGANTAIFSIVNGVLFQPLPIPQPQQMAILTFQQAKSKNTVLTAFSYPDLQDVRQQTTGVFSGVAAYTFGLDGIQIHGKADRIMTNYVTGNFFQLMGIQPLLGRLILPNDGGETAATSPVLVLSYLYWQSQFGGDPNIVGKSVTLDGHPVTIVGVTAKGFHGATPMMDAQGYLPLGMVLRTQYVSDPQFFQERQQRALFTLARLRPGVSLAGAQAGLNVIGDRLAQAYPKLDAGMRLQAYSQEESGAGPDPDHQVQLIASLFLALAGLVLVLACVNVANILLVRATARGREMAIRAALGAGRGRLVRQLLTESLILAVAGGGVGLLLGVGASHLISRLPMVPDWPILFNFGLDWRVFWYAFAAALFTGLVVGIMPALRASRADMNRVLNSGARSLGGGRQRFRSALVTAQVAGSLLLLIIAGLFTRSLGQAQQAKLGFDANQLLDISMDPNEIGFNEAQAREFQKTLLARARALPGVQSAALAFSVPIGFYSNGDTLQFDNYQPPPGEPAPQVSYNMVSPGYFANLRIPILEGRDFTDADQKGSQPVGIVNQAMAAKYWPGEDALGHTFTLAAHPNDHVRVVGVARDSRVTSLTSPIAPYFYQPLTQNFSTLATLQARTAAADPLSMTHPAEALIASLAPGMPLFDVQSMEQSLNGLNGFMIFEIGALLAGALGLLGLILAVIGVYGVISYATAQRTHEIGMRMALGAQPGDVLRLILGQGVAIVAGGVIAGLAAAWASARVVGKFLVGVSPTDPLTFVSISLALTAAALMACYLPARRAARVDPNVALRYD